MATADLVTVDEALAFLAKASANDVPVLAALVTLASSWVERITDRPLAKRAFTSLRLTGTDAPQLYVPAWPIDPDSTVTVTLDGTTLTVWRKEADGTIDNFDVIVGSDDPWDERFGMRNHLYRELGWATSGTWTEAGPWLGMGASPFRDMPAAIRPYRVLLSYTGGYATASIPQDLKLACLYLIQKLWQDQEGQQTGLQSLSTPTGGTIVLPPDPSIPAEVKILLRPYARNGVLVGIA